VFYWVLKTIVLGPLLRALFRPWVRGIENVPDSGPAILVSNHLSFSDSFFLPLVVPRRITFLAKADYFTGRGVKGRLTAGFFRGVGQVPVDRSGGEASEAALRTGLKVLGTGNLLGIYPEGTRSPDGRLYRGKTGVARMALEGKVPVLPVVMKGTDKVQPIGRKVPSIRRVGVIIGAPLDFSRYEGMESDRLVLRSITDEIMYELMRLSGQQYVDVYAATMKEQLAEAVRDRIAHARTRAQSAAAAAAARAADARAKVEAAKADMGKGDAASASGPNDGSADQTEATVASQATTGETPDPDDTEGLTVDLDGATGVPSAPSGGGTPPPGAASTTAPVDLRQHGSHPDPRAAD
jgi:1-acyl-sn-glycerol-3-phosphate acyltransferase